MAVGIDNGCLKGPVCGPEVFQHYRFYVYYAKTSIAVYYPLGMVARRPDKGKGLIDFFSHYRLGSFYCPAC